MCKTYQDSYEKLLTLLPKAVDYCKATGRRVVFGYTSDLDLLLKWNAEKLNGLLKKYLREVPAKPADDTLRSMEDLAVFVSYLVQNGMGGEADILNGDLCRVIEETFEMDNALGGSSAQAAAAFGAVGFPFVSCLTDNSREVVAQMDYPGAESVSNGRLVPITEIAADVEPVKHYVLQYPKGDVLTVMGKDISIPLSNRVILDYDFVHKNNPFKKAFGAFLEEHADMVISHMISGFNVIVDPEIARDCAGDLIPHYKRLKEKNPDCLIYLECAHYFSPQVRSVLFGALIEVIDVLGINEEELSDLTRELGQEADIASPEGILQGLALLMRHYPTKAIIMHTKDYAMFFGKELPGCSVELGLTMGNLMAATRARTGRYGSAEDCRETIRQLPISEKGLLFAQTVPERYEGFRCCVVPARYMERPAFTIGLGDTFTAGMQLGFIPFEE